MNKITGVERNIANGQYVNKNFEVIVPAEKCALTCADGEYRCGADGALIIPPRTAYEYAGGADDIKITLEQALISLKKITAVSGGEAREFAHTAEQAEIYFNSANPKSNLILAALGDLLAGYIAAFAGGKSFSPVVEIVCADISAHVSDATYNLEDALKKLPLNYDYVRKLFKKETGVTPHEFLLRERMRLAQGLILGGMSNQYSAYSVSQIAEACGFSEPLYFSRVFKKYFGASPANYK